MSSASYRRLLLDVTNSTNDDALDAAKAGDPGQLWILAAQQRAGRGRHGRSWISPSGNLHASLLLIDPCLRADAAQLGFVAGLALHEAVVSTLGIEAPRIALKWPNDLLADGAKSAGILIEGHSIEGKFVVILGFGVNVEAAPAQMPYPTVALRDLDPTMTRDKLFEALAQTFPAKLAAWKTHGFGMLRKDWLKRAAGVGSPVVIKLPSGVKSGIFEGLDPIGRLQLQTVTGMQLIDAGDLFFSPADFKRPSEPKI